MTRDEFEAGKSFLIDDEPLRFNNKDNILTLDDDRHSIIYEIDDDGFCVENWPFEDIRIEFSRCTVFKY
ncbi:hypothetical protein J3L18_05460 [Mucilaginibacter gossypii]|uniref:hypothetical protein n=1 Tax=Mucilaginibacter gossypii TaxID=551996 RepID=UPI000DCDB001|nr:MULTISPECIES: hypothetical protein [Mucilaginibacter]QTE38526.1 hypothetical protein J3L18_05460 [Mucilaginibacter gossypii]RAV55738.1 hypothetical protein DIU36_16740 [Mucilaginibacter rubeus]